MTSRVSLHRVELPDSSASAVAQWLAANPTFVEQPRKDGDDFIGVLFGDDDERFVADSAPIVGVRALSRRGTAAVLAGTAAVAAACAVVVWALWPAASPEINDRPAFRAQAWMSELRAAARQIEQNEEIARAEAEAEESARAAAAADQGAAEEGLLVPPPDPLEAVEANEPAAVEANEPAPANEGIATALAGVQAAQATTPPGSPQAELLAQQAEALLELAATYGLKLSAAD